MNLKMTDFVKFGIGFALGKEIYETFSRTSAEKFNKMAEKKAREGNEFFKIYIRTLNKQNRNDVYTETKNRIGF